MPCHITRIQRRRCFTRDWLTKSCAKGTRFSYFSVADRYWKNNSGRHIRIPLLPLKKKMLKMEKFFKRTKHLFFYIFVQ